MIPRATLECTRRGRFHRPSIKKGAKKMAYTPMFEKLINTKPERELCLKFLKFLEDKGIVQGDINTEEIVAEFFEIDIEQAEEERKMLIKEFHEDAAANSHTASEALARMGRQRERREKKDAGIHAENAGTGSGNREEEKEFKKEAGKRAEAKEAAEHEAAKGTEAEDEKVKLNSHGVNAKIKAHIFDDAKMREFGFTDYAKDRWYFCRGINFKDVKKKRDLKNIDISFSVTIPKDGSDIQIDVLDEWFCQPYDYQYILEKDPGHKIANIVKEQVEYWMEKLQEEGVLEGHVRGEYI